MGTLSGPVHKCRTIPTMHMRSRVSALNRWEGLVRKILYLLGCPSVRDRRAWTRTDLQSATTRTTVRGGPAWGVVVTRVNARASHGQMILAEKA